MSGRAIQSPVMCGAGGRSGGGRWGAADHAKCSGLVESAPVAAQMSDPEAAAKQPVAPRQRGFTESRRQ